MLTREESAVHQAPCREVARDARERFLARLLLLQRLRLEHLVVVDAAVELVRALVGACGDVHQHLDLLREHLHGRVGIARKSRANRLRHAGSRAIARARRGETQAVALGRRDARGKRVGALELPRLRGRVGRRVEDARVDVGQPIEQLRALVAARSGSEFLHAQRGERVEAVRVEVLEQLVRVQRLRRGQRCGAGDEIRGDAA